MITITQERYVPRGIKSNSHYSVTVDGTIVYRGTLKACKEKQKELKKRHPYSTNGLTQMEGFQHHFRNKHYN